MPGILYLCATPIGNLKDISTRVLETLAETDLIAAEDTRVSLKLLNHYGIKTPLTSFHEHNKIEKSRILVDRLLSGENIALVTDAGTPGISDPGELLVAECIEAGITVTSLPGPAACIVALTASGLPCRRFTFEAFLPREKKERSLILEELKEDTRTIIIYEAPHHLESALSDLLEALGDRRIAVCRELTKKFEEIKQSTLSEALEDCAANPPRGEYVICIDGKSREEKVREAREVYLDMSIPDHMALYTGQGVDRKEAMKLVALDRGISKRDVYQSLLK